jgi:phenylpropionate dioxygenase-like ring-hydroxylating dioxygenase large terminal subunit
MIPNLWYAALESREVRPGRPVGVTRFGERLVLWRDSRGQVACLRDACAHRGAALSGGKVCGDRVACPFHGFEYDASGACRLIPANGRDVIPPSATRVDGYPAREAHGFVWLFYGEPRSAEDYPEIPWFDDVDASFSRTTIASRWNAHYSRAIENQLDVVHLPFVHHNTIGRGNRTLVDGPVTVLEADELRLWVYNRIDDGSPPKRPSELPPATRPPFLLFHFPNVWQNRISDDMRIVVAFAPIDHAHTLLYVHNFQRMVRTPVVGKIVDLASNLGSRVILSQDQRVVETQLPKRSELKGGERLIMGDQPIIVYRRRREALIDAARG